VNRCEAKNTCYAGGDKSFNKEITFPYNRGFQATTEKGKVIEPIIATLGTAG